MEHGPQLIKLFAEALRCQSLGNKSGELVAYKRMQRQFPDFAEAWANASVVLFELGRIEEALESALRATELAPEDPTALCALANAQHALGHIGDASANFRKTLKYDPNNLHALMALAGICTDDDKNFAEALELADRAVQIQPSLSSLWDSRGSIKLGMLDMAGATADYRQALLLDKNNSKADQNLICALLLQNRHQEAWQRVDNNHAWLEWLHNAQPFGKPLWKGEALGGRTLMVYDKSHGFGDTIQYARLLPQVRQQAGGPVTLLVHEPLRRILANIPGIDGLAVSGGTLPDCDFVFPVLELPLILKVDPSSLPPPVKISAESKPLPEFDRPGFKIGLVWTGNPDHANNAFRSIPPSHLNALADIPDIAWYGLQKPPSAEPPKLPGFMDLSCHMGDFLDTAQIALQLDLIVTVDTAMAHLAGSLNLPAIVLLHYLPDCRWGIKGQHSPWYPSLTLLRQPAHSDWHGTIKLLKERIAEFSERGGK
jgi:tetratricopeptide (TPR) repeat protein